MNCKWKTHYACSAAALALAATLSPARANAQAPAAEPADPAVSVSAEASAEAPVPELVAEPAPPPPPPPPAEDKPLFRWYGIIKPTVLAGTAVESFGNTNFTAVTAAANPLAVHNPDAAATSFQVGQTRFGLAVGEGLPVKGQIEFDFVDFPKSSPAQVAWPRVRQAFVEWTFAEGQKLTLGQLWDLFSPLNSHTYDLVGGMFQAGNSGFMRHQIIWLGTFGSIEAGAAVGFTAQNATPTINQVEYGRVPTFSARVAYKKDKALNVGVSGIATRLMFNATLPTEETTLAFAGNAFADATFGGFNLRAELYGGQNLANIGALTLAVGTAAEDYTEIGGWVSGKYTADKHSVHGVVGMAMITNEDDLVPVYTANDPMTPANEFSRGGIGGIRRNVAVRVGYAYSPYKGFSLVAEPYLFLTSHVLEQAVIDADIDEDRTAYGLQLGGLYTF